MKKYLKYIIVLAVFLAAGCAVYTAPATGQAENYANADKISFLRQLITADTSTSRTIMWQADEKLENPAAEYKNAAGQITAVPASMQELNTGSGTLYVYTSALTGLEPGSAYEYRAGYEGSRTGWHKLPAAQPDSFKALIFPDSQSSDYSGWQKLAQTAYSKNDDAAFFINMGDLVDNGYDFSQWRAWFNSVAPMIENIPFAPVMGNHETYNIDWQIAPPTPYLTLFNLPENGTGANKNQYYSFDYGDVHFVVLNTQTDEMADFNPDLMQQQLSWLRSDLAGTQSKWKIVLMHKDILRYAFTDRPNNFDPASIQFTPWAQQLMPVFEEYNVDAVLTAHLHTYRRRVPLKAFKPDNTGITYILTGVAGSVRYANLWQRNTADAARGRQLHNAQQNSANINL